MAHSKVRDHIPLEQGLRLLSFPAEGISAFVRDHIPLEQGLRLEAGTDELAVLCQRPYSIRTRIKT